MTNYYGLCPPFSNDNFDRRKIIFAYSALRYQHSQSSPSVRHPFTTSYVRRAVKTHWTWTVIFCCVYVCVIHTAIDGDTDVLGERESRINIHTISFALLSISQSLGIYRNFLVSNHMTHCTSAVRAIRALLHTIYINFFSFLHHPRRSGEDIQFTSFFVCVPSAWIYVLYLRLISSLYIVIIIISYISNVNLCYWGTEAQHEPAHERKKYLGMRQLTTKSEENPKKMIYSNE